MNICILLCPYLRAVQESDRNCLVSTHRRVKHRDFSATECPASIAGSQHATYMARAIYWYDQISGNKPQASSAGKPDIEALANPVIRGEYGNGDQRRARLGSLYDAVQCRVNENSGKDLHRSHPILMPWQTPRFEETTATALPAGRAWEIFTTRYKPE